MTKASSDFITLGADVGGKDAFGATNQHILELRGLLRQISSSAFGCTLKEIALVLRVDGSVQAWGKNGVDNIYFQKKKAFVTADIFVSADVWMTGDSSRIRQFLLDQVACAIRLVVENVNQQGVSLNEVDLIEAIEEVRRQYLN